MTEDNDVLHDEPDIESTDDLDTRIAKMEAELNSKQEAEISDETTDKVEEKVKEVVEAKVEESSEEEVEEEVKEELETIEEMKMRVRKMHMENREGKRAVQAAQRKLDAYDAGQPLPRDEAVYNEAKTLAKQIAVEDNWNKECNRIADLGQKEFSKSFDKTVNDLRENFPQYGGIPSPFVEGAMEAMPGQEHKVLAYLASNLDVAEDILAMTPVKQGVAFAKLVSKINPPKPISKAPPPIETVTKNAKDTAGKRSGFYTGMSTADFFAESDKQDKARRGY